MQEEPHPYLSAEDLATLFRNESMEPPSYNIAIGSQTPPPLYDDITSGNDSISSSPPPDYQASREEPPPYDGQEQTHNEQLDGRGVCVIQDFVEDGDLGLGQPVFNTYESRRAPIIT